MRGNGKVDVVVKHSRVTPYDSSLNVPEDSILLKPFKLACLQWPQDAKRIAKLPLEDFQIWISTIDPRELIYLAQNPAFERFLFWHYLLPVRCFRLLLKAKKRLKGFFG